MLKEGLISPPGVTTVGKTAYAIEGKITYLIDPKLKGQEPGPVPRPRHSPALSRLPASTSAGASRGQGRVGAAVLGCAPQPVPLRGRGEGRETMAGRLQTQDQGARPDGRGGGADLRPAAGRRQAAPAKDARACQAQIAQLSAEVDQLEGARAVRKLQRAYGYYIDRGLWDEAADLFADDGTVEIGMDGVYVGKARVREYLKRLGGGQDGLIYGQLYEHAQLQPEVDVAADGLSAKGRWRELQMTGHFGKDAFWGDGIEENTYVKEGGVWKIKACTSTSTSSPRTWAAGRACSRRPRTGAATPPRPSRPTDRRASATGPSRTRTSRRSTTRTR